jgi:hypothetical protein
MEQYKTEVKRQGDKHRLVRNILQCCHQTNRYVIFVRANETVRQLQKLVRHLSACKETNALSIIETILGH